jgi:hypothetical protein
VIVNTAITTVTNTSTGGAIASYAISPAAPAGLTFSTSTGQLSGTPTSIQSATAYTITATNSAGSATATFTLTVTTAAPAFSLSSASETRVVTTAITGYTITSTGAPITSYSYEGTLPSGLAFSTSTGRITGTPTETRTATTYTIIGASASGETATATYRLRVTGDIGDTGPGGGKIFYYFANGFACGPNFTDTGSPTGGKCRWLEVAPALWNGGASDPTRLWGANGKVSGLTGRSHNNADLLNARDIGVGYRDSILIVNRPETTNAAALARAYNGSSLNDWYLGSPVELTLLCQWARGLPSNIESGCTDSGTLVSGFTGDRYWSSTQEAGPDSYAYQVNFNGTNPGTPPTNLMVGASLRASAILSVRPIRAF